MKKLTRIITIVALSIFCFSTNAQIVDGVRLTTTKRQMWEVDKQTKEYKLTYERDVNTSFLLSNKDYYIYQEGKLFESGKWEYQGKSSKGDYNYSTELAGTYGIDPDYDVVMKFLAWDDNLGIFKLAFVYIVDRVEHIKPE